MSQAIENPPADVRLIESDQEFFSKSGPLPLHWNDVRQFPRFYLRSRTEAVVFPFQSQPTATPKACRVATSDVSRGGMNLMTGEQVFPGQRIDVRLASGDTRTLKVVWCRRVGQGCYSAGTHFVS
ncbi:MAG TPA: PilZ domain-containing protein [Pirellulaceae bacterium]|jgi:hypothetical protein